LDLTKDQIQEIIMKDERTIKQLEGRTPNKLIIVPGKIKFGWIKTQCKDARRCVSTILKFKFHI
jgi:hypothetical protein